MLRFSLFVDRPTIEKKDPVRDVISKTEFMRHADHGHSFLSQLAHGLENFADQLGIERGGDFIEQHHVGVHGQRARDGDTLFLATRQARWIFAGLVDQPDTLKLRHAMLTSVASAATVQQQQYSRSEIRFVSTIDVAETQQQADTLAREHRELSKLLHMQREDRDLDEVRGWEDLLLDATESALEPDEED